VLLCEEKKRKEGCIMKKIVLMLAVLMLASPAWAEVIIIADNNGVGIDCNEIVISYDARTEAQLPRAFSLNIQSNDANIIEVRGVNPDFPIHPGTISIDLSGPEPSIDYGTPVAPQSDLPSDTLPGLGTPGITIEMGSLYAPTGPGSPNAPDPCGVLLTIVLDGHTGCVTITGNVARAGSKGVVLEDPAVDPTVTNPVPGSVCTRACAPPCWGPTHCHGDTNKDGSVNTTDFFALKDSWMKCAPDPLYNECADFNRDGCVNTTDFFTLKDNWMQTVPANCP
jgi:hypothetical protein